MRAVTRNRASKQPKALDGILVVSLEQAVAAPMATCRLADAGARVIKVERPGGDFARNYDQAGKATSSYFAWLNRGKESVVIDLDDRDDASLLHRIVREADVFVQNLAVGAAARKGFGSDELRRMHPELITCDISGYGEAGPYRDMKAYDLLVQAESGFVSISGAPGAYGRTGVSICDIATGLNAALAIQQALIKRQRTGIGESVYVSLFDSMADWMTVPYLHQVYLGAAPPRIGLAHPSIAPYGEFRTEDGEPLLIAIQNEREWRNLVMHVLEKPEWLSDERFATNDSRVANRDVVDEGVQEAIERVPKVELLKRLQVSRIAFGKINSVAGLASHPQLRTMNVEVIDDTITCPAAPIRGDDYSGFGPVPQLDEHGPAIRQEFFG